jgi:hypothetical protein
MDSTVFFASFALETSEYLSAKNSAGASDMKRKWVPAKAQSYGKTQHLCVFASLRLCGNLFFS